MIAFVSLAALIWGCVLAIGSPVSHELGVWWGFLVVRAFTAARLDSEAALRAIAETNAWNAGHRLPTAFISSDPGSAMIATQIQLPAPAGLTDPQLHDTIGIAIAATLQFWKEHHAAEIGTREEGAA